MDVVRNIAVLAGNGLSISINEELNLWRITEEVLARIGETQGGEVVRAMQEIAKRALPEGARSAEDFEILVGAFGAQSRTLGALDALAQLTNPEDCELSMAIARVVNFATQVRDSGVSHVLEVIANTARADESSSEALIGLVREVLRSFDGQVTIGNLNYDTLLLAALMRECQSELADLGDGRSKVNVLVKDKLYKTVPSLRRNVSDFPPNRRVKLLGLHGSLTFWRGSDGCSYGKLDVEMAREESLWKGIREQTTKVRPLVVLSSQGDKADLVDEYPFSLAYEMFQNGLSSSNEWLVIGYSFRDDPVNTLLRSEFIDRKCKPHVLVVTLGDIPARRDVERALGWGAEDGPSERWLTIDRGGATGMEARAPWENFVSSSCASP